MKLLVVIVNYKVTDLTIDCLRSLAAEIQALGDARVAICENGTGPEHADRLRKVIDKEGWGQWASVTAISPNRGFTGGNNAVLEPALAGEQPPAYFLLLNADTIVRPGAFLALLEFMDRHPTAGISGSRLENPNGTGQVSAFRFHNFLCEFNRGLRLGVIARILKPYLTAMPIPEKACRVDWVSGASLMVRREVLQQAGTLDEEYYTYFDDIDLCHRGLKAGWETWYVPESRVVHLVGQTTGIRTTTKRRPEYWFQARRLFFLKHKGRFGALLADAAFISGYAIWRLRRWISRKPDSDPPHLLRDAVRHSVFCTGFAPTPVKNPLL